MMTLIFWIVPVLPVVSNLSIYGYALGMDVNMEVIVSILIGGILSCWEIICRRIIRIIRVGIQTSMDLEQ